jgi:hypothetical protein
LIHKKKIHRDSRILFVNDGSSNTIWKIIKELVKFKKVCLFLGEMIPLVGFKSTCTYYTRNSRMAGKGHYLLNKMLTLAFKGSTSLSAKPLTIITSFGIFISSVSFIGAI